MTARIAGLVSVIGGAVSFAAYVPMDDDLGVMCQDCNGIWLTQPSDFIRYNKWADKWVTLAEEDGTVLPQTGVCKGCQDEANHWHDMNRYGGPNHAQIEARIMEDERYVWDQ